MPESKSSTALLLIGLFKLVKGTLLLVAGFGLLHLLHRDVAETVGNWVQLLRVDPDNRYIHQWLSRAANVSPKQLRELSLGTFIYSALFLIEGTGLLARKRWAEYVTVITTGLLMPLEIYGIARNVTPAGIAVLILNAVIVLYLINQLRQPD